MSPLFLFLKIYFKHLKVSSLFQTFLSRVFKATAFLLPSKGQSNTFWMLHLLLSLLRCKISEKACPWSSQTTKEGKKSGKGVQSSLSTPLLTDEAWPEEQVGKSTEKGESGLSWQESGVTIASEIHAHMHLDYSSLVPNVWSGSRWHRNWGGGRWGGRAGAGGSTVSIQEQERLDGCSSADSVLSLSPKCQPNSSSQARHREDVLSCSTG